MTTSALSLSTFDADFSHEEFTRSEHVDTWFDIEAGDVRTTVLAALDVAEVSALSFDGAVEDDTAADMDWFRDTLPEFSHSARQISTPAPARVISDECYSVQIALGLVAKVGWEPASIDALTAILETSRNPRASAKRLAELAGLGATVAELEVAHQVRERWTEFAPTEEFVTQPWRESVRFSPSKRPSWKVTLELIWAFGSVPSADEILVLVEETHEDWAAEWSQALQAGRFAQKRPSEFFSTYCRRRFAGLLDASEPGASLSWAGDHIYNTGGRA